MSDQSQSQPQQQKQHKPSGDNSDDGDEKTSKASKSRAVSEEPSSSTTATEDKQQADGGGGTVIRTSGGTGAGGGHVPNRNSNSLRQFTQRFRSFSNDLLRSIGSAHDMVALGNSNLPFSAATQLAAAQHVLAGPSIYLATTGGSGLVQDNQGTTNDANQNDINATELGLSDVREEEDDNDEAYDDDVLISDDSGGRHHEDLNRAIQLGKSETSSVVGGDDGRKSSSLQYNVNDDDAHEKVNVVTDEEIQEMIVASGGASQSSPSKTQHYQQAAHNVPPQSSLSTTSKPIQLNRVTAIDEVNTALTNDPSRRVLYRQSTALAESPSHAHPHHHHHRGVSGGSALAALTAAAASQAPTGLLKLPTSKDQTDFRVKKRHLLKNGIKIAIPDDIRISILEVFIYLWGVITFFADLISDIILSVEYYKSSRTWLGSMTLTFVIVPNVTLSLFSLSWYIDKYYNEKRIKQEKEKLNGNVSSSPLQQQHEQQQQQQTTPQISSTCDSITFWITTIFFVVFQLDLVWKYIQGFVYTLKGWAWGSLFKNLKWEKYYIKKQIKCDTDIGMLRLIDVFLDSGPQVLLQLYVITTQNLNEIGSANLVYLTFKDFQTTSVELKQLISILSSLFSMGYALAGYHRCLRNQQFIFCLETNQPLPRPMSWPSTIMQFLWYLCLIAPRVLSMAIFASTFRSWFFMIIFTHWLIMYFWILSLKTNYCISSSDVYNAREEIFEKFYNFVCSFIYIFVYFNLKAGPTRLRYLIYYVVFYAENILFCSCYFMFSKETNYDYKLTMLLIVVLGFWLAIAFQVVYYLYCHPSHNISMCVRNKNTNKCDFIYKERLKPKSKTHWASDNQVNQVTTQTTGTGAKSRNQSFSTPNGLGRPPPPPLLSDEASIRLVELKRGGSSSVETTPMRLSLKMTPASHQAFSAPSSPSTAGGGGVCPSFSSYSSYRHTLANDRDGGGDDSAVSIESSLSFRSIDSALRNTPPPLVRLCDLVDEDDDDDNLIIDNRRSLKETSL